MQFTTWTAAAVALYSVGFAPGAKAQAPPVPGAVASSPAPAPPEPFKLAEPMSQRLILVRGPFSGSFHLDRGGTTVVDSPYATGLDLAVAGSDRAVALAGEAHSDLVTGAALTWTGLGLLIASAVGVLAISAAYAPTDNSPASAAFNVGLSCTLGGVLVGLVLDLVGIPFQTAGTRAELDAVNAYNSDLVDGRLR